MNNQEAIEFLKGMQGPLVDYADLVGAEGFAYGCRYVYLEPEDYAIELAIAALEEQQSRRWIPVEERLPETPEENPVFDGKEVELYLVTVKGGEYPFRAFWNGREFTDGWMKCNVSAWQPLPEPYKQEKGE